MGVSAVDKEPFANRVWDTEKDDIAGAGNQLLQFLSEDKAREICVLLNRQEERIAA
jgi:hypothetical protein